MQEVRRCARQPGRSILSAHKAQSKPGAAFFSPPAPSMVLNMVTIKTWKDFFPYPRKGHGYDGVMSEPVTPLLAAIKGLASLIPEAAGSAVALRLNTIPLQ